MNGTGRPHGGQRPREGQEPPAYTIPIRLGDMTVGWATEELARRLSQTPTPQP